MRITTLIRCSGIIQISPRRPSAKEKREDGQCGGYTAHDLLQILKHDLLGSQLLYLGVGHPAGEEEGAVRNVLTKLFQ